MDAIEKIISDNLTYLTVVPQFFLGYPEEFNKILDKLTDPVNPVCLMDHFVPQTITYGSSGNLQVISDLTILLLKGYPEDVTPELFEAPTISEERNLLVIDMRERAYELISTLDQDSRLVSQSQYKVTAQVRAVYNLFDSNLDGVEMQIKLRQDKGRFKCGTHEGPDPAFLGASTFVQTDYIEPSYVN